VADPHARAAGDSASPRLGEYTTVQWGVPGGAAMPRRPSVAVSPLEGRPFARLDPVARRRRDSEHEKDVELAQELKDTGEIEQIEEEDSEREQRMRQREPA